MKTTYPETGKNPAGRPAGLRGSVGWILPCVSVALLEKTPSDLNFRPVTGTDLVHK